ncbi:extracellular calcium-sensing receptor-like [Solea solea]|uniref:extracellular calcium-sensing receptor-like n=1 Tax=Solea solea TaxID=90069 RepID=UPI00272DB68B|nr:extracellular calcium-sensing receptor-like [Solea solea]
MARKKGEPECCFDCVPCSEGKISNTTDSMECTSCPEDFWSSPQRDHCVPKKTDFLSYHEPLGICLTTTSLLGTFTCVVVLGIFIHHRSTPIVRANNSELSFQLLLSLKFCFLCSLLFIGRPRLWTCQLRHAAFGISFVLCVSCILVKTMVVLAVFRASKPGGESSLKWFGAVQQRGTVLVLTSVQAAICTVWLVSASPVPHKNTQYHSDKIVYECAVGSTVGFAVLLGYIGLLAFLSCLLAFLARNLPDSFNEAKLGIQHITNCKPSNGTAANGDASLAEELNCFFPRFKVKPEELVTALPPALNNNNYTLSVQENEVRRVLRAVNPKKAAGPDGVTGRFLKECAEQLSKVFTKIFNLSLSKSIIPPCLKSATIVPVPKSLSSEALTTTARSPSHQSL